MTVKAFAQATGFKDQCLPAPEKKVSGAYVGDLLSWVMGRASASDAWITIMSNNNVVAVATLCDASCIILAEGVTLDAQVLDLAREKGVNVLLSELSTYETAIKVSGVLK